MIICIPITDANQFRLFMEGLDDVALKSQRTGSYRTRRIHAGGGVTVEVEFNLPFNLKAKPLVKRQAPARKEDSDAK